MPLGIASSWSEEPKSVPVVSAVAGNGKVTLRWSDVPGASGYSVYRSTTGAF